MSAQHHSARTPGKPAAAESPGRALDDSSLHRDDVPHRRGAIPSHAGTHGHLHVPGRTAIHRIDAAPKLVGVVAFVFIAVLTPRQLWPALIGDVVLIAVLLAVARVPWRAVLRRGLVIVPVLVFAALVPVIGGGPTVELGPISLSESGLWSAWNIGVKATVGVLASILLTATTPVNDIIAGLGRLRLPRLVVAIIGMMVRYLDLIDDRLARMRQAMIARCYDPRWLWQIKPIAQSSGTLFVRTYERGERIHQAMLARGYTGEMPRLDEPRARASDWLTALAPAGIATVLFAAAAATTGTVWQ